ncbi:MAG: polysaccharide deacetylase family protein [Planctomycetota bacterium]
MAILIECARNEALLDSLLSQLDQTDTPAAFAVDDWFALRRPGVLRRIDSAGHLIVNAGPTFQSANLFAGYPSWRRMIDETEDAIYGAIGRRPLLFAPPCSIKSPVMLREAAWVGHGLVVRARGQHGWLPQRIDLRRLTHVPAAGIVAVRADRPRTLEQLPSLLEAWRSRGRWITRLDVLLNVPPYRLASLSD